jgi:hypothetical protein
MQTFLAISIVLSAVAYVTWQWTPTMWRKALVARWAGTPLGNVDRGPQQSRSSGCSSCSTCGACSRAQLGS